MNLVFEYPFDAKELFVKRKSLKASLLKTLPTSDIKRIKIAILGGSTTSDIRQVIELMFLNVGILTDFFESDYNRYSEVVLFESGPLWAFSPDIIYIHTTIRNINFAETPESIFKNFQNIWSTIKLHCNATIIQNNFESLPLRTFGNLETSTSLSKTTFIREVNASFSAYAAEARGFYLNDISHLSSLIGTSQWFDAAYWNNYKLPYSAACTPYVARSFFSISMASLGKSKKCLVLDLDNTLWGGVIGDDGISGISLGEGDALGEAYLDFQKYIKSLSDRGVLLAVCSKNDFELAKSAFEHPDSFLKFSDFSSFQANWDPKTEGLKKIALELNLGLDSLVFIDDNPAEREWIRKQLPLISVPEVGTDVSSYARHLDLNGYFESAKILADDIEKHKRYADNRNRELSEAHFKTYHDFLASLEMSCEIGTVNEQNVDRITQLINKTNQFNLTSKKVAADAMLARMNNPAFFCLYGRLKDKFGDNGLVSVISGSISSETASIDIWVMSCRVFKRDLEYAMFDQLVSACVKLGIKQIIGKYIATDRNQLVEDLYSKLGFEKTSESEWKMSALLSYKTMNHAIRLET